MTPTAPTDPTTSPAGPRHRHADTPDTDAWFHRLATLAEGTERSRLLDDLMTAWLPMAHRIALRYRDRGEETEDLLQVAALGLAKALDRFDPHRGHAFAGYAVPVVTGEIRRHFRDNTWDLHVPRRTKELRNLVRRAAGELGEEHPGSRGAQRRLAEHLDIDEEEVRRGVGALDSYACLSLDAPTGAAGRPLAETLGDCDSDYERVTERVSVRPYLRALPARERAVLHLRFFRDLTQRQIAQRLSLSQMHVSRILRRVCEGAREHVEGAVGTDDDGAEGTARPGDAASAPPEPATAPRPVPRRSGGSGRGGVRAAPTGRPRAVSAVLSRPGRADGPPVAAAPPRLDLPPRGAAPARTPQPREAGEPGPAEAPGRSAA
ncbi:SigB/SigF/SigG family RNA polymerase sigma factor, partial [Streptomyces lonarensis]